MRTIRNLTVGLRAIRVLPSLYQAVSVHLVEINPALIDRQKETLRGVKLQVSWHDRIDSVVNTLIGFEPSVLAPAHCTGYRAAYAEYQQLVEVMREPWAGLQRLER